MGIKTKVSKEDLPLKYQKYNLIETKDGVSDSVYLMEDKYVLKIYEDIDYNIDHEVKLLNIIRELKIIQFVEQLEIYKKPAIIYKYIVGKSIYTPNITHLKQISIFLKEFHSKTQGKISKNKDIFSNSYLKSVIQNSGNILLQNYFDSIKIELKNDGIIHGDIFPDNVYFLDDKLSGVFDFSHACNGDFLFDLAVVAISWCFDDVNLNKQKLQVLIENYDKSLDLKHFNEYMKYALLYFATIRFVDNRNYQELIDKLESLMD